MIFFVYTWLKSAGTKCWAQVVTVLIVLGGVCKRLTILFIGPNLILLMGVGIQTVWLHAACVCVSGACLCVCVCVCVCV